MADEGDLFQTHDFFFHGRWHDQWHSALWVFTAFYQIDVTNAMDLLQVAVVAVEAEILLHYEEHDQATGDAQSKPTDVDQGKSLVPGEVSEEDFEVVLKHGKKLNILSFYTLPYSKRVPDI